MDEDTKAIIAKQARRIDVLEIAVAELQGKSAKRVPAPVIDEGAKITYLPAFSGPVPTDSEFDQLLKVVTDRFSMLRFEPASTRFAADDLRDDRDGFVAAFKWVQTLGRTELITTKFAPTYWVDKAELYRRNRELPGTCRRGSLLAAVIATGDVAYSIDQYPHVFAVGLNVLGAAGKPASADGWSRVLAGRILDPVVVSKPGAVPQPSIRIA